MADSPEQAEGEFTGVPGGASAGLEAAMELALARRRGKAKSTADDPELDNFLRGQARLAEHHQMIEKKVVPGGGFEPPTRGFSIRCSTN